MSNTEEASSSSAVRYQRPESVVVVVYTTVGEILLLKRLQPVFWQSITGGLNWPDENPAVAAQRELREETGIHAVDGWINWKISRYFSILPEFQDRFAPGTRLNEEHMFSLQISDRCSVSLMEGEHSEYCWLPFLEGRSRLWSWTNRAAVDQVAASWVQTQTNRVD